MHRFSLLAGLATPALGALQIIAPFGGDFPANGEVELKWNPSTTTAADLIARIQYGDVNNGSTYDGFKQELKNSAGSAILKTGLKSCGGCWVQVETVGLGFNEWGYSTFWNGSDGPKAAEVKNNESKEEAPKTDGEEKPTTPAEGGSGGPFITEVVNDVASEIGDLLDGAKLPSGDVDLGAGVVNIPGASSSGGSGGSVGSDGSNGSETPTSSDDGSTNDTPTPTQTVDVEATETETEPESDDEDADDDEDEGERPGVTDDTDGASIAQVSKLVLLVSAGFLALN